MSEDTKATIDILESYWKKGGFYEIPVEVINVVEAELEEKENEIERLNNIIKTKDEGIKAFTEDLCEESEKIEKAIEYMNNYIKVEDAPINERINIEFKEVIKLLQGSDKE